MAARHHKKRPPRRQNHPAGKASSGPATVHLRSASRGVFLFSRMVGRVEGPALPGDLVRVIDPKGEPFGWAIYNPDSQIALRMVSRQEDPLPDDWLARRIARAVRLRTDVLHLPDVTEAYRLVHAEGDELTGLVADRFGGIVVIEPYSIGMAVRMEDIEDAFVDAGLDVEGFHWIFDKHVARQEGFPNIRRKPPAGGNLVVREHDVKFHIDLARGHKTGFFCDQRDNRRDLATLTAGQSVLDVCCYTGGFGLYAAGPGAAKTVTAVDLDEKALAVAQRNADGNDAAIQFHHADAFDFLRNAAETGQRWDVVVVDPSKFVPRRNMLEAGLRKYADLNRLALAVVNEGGLLLTCSCSGLVDVGRFTGTILRAARHAERDLQMLQTSGAAPDHPAWAGAPESLYLKALWCRVF